MSFATGQAWAVKVGNTACYILEFYRPDSNGVVSGAPILTVSTNSHVTSIEATLPGGLAAGRYVFRISGLSDSDFALIQPTESQFIICKLYLFWGDAVSWDWHSIGSSIVSYLSNAVGTNTGIAEGDMASALVSQLALLRVKREKGDTRYITVIEAGEHVARQLALTPTGSRPPATDYREAFTTIANLAHVPFVIHPASGALTTAVAGAEGSEQYTFAPEWSSGRTLLDLASKVETNRNRYGRGLLLIRDGQVHFGLRPIPVVASDPYELVASTGLLAVTPDQTADVDPFASISFESSTPATSMMSQQRTRYTVILKGRADIKPGDLVKFDVPVQSTTTLGSVGQAMIGSFAGSILESDTLSSDAKTAYVDGVTHKQSVTEGFVTTLRVITTTGMTEEELWDVRIDVPSTGPTATATGGSDGASRAASAIRSSATSSARRIGLEVGEIRQFVSDGTEEPPGQTSRVWAGVVDDGRPNAARRIDIHRLVRNERVGLGYVSPFSWGKAGLFLPRYPGMRVILGCRNGDPSDMVDLGAISKSNLTSQNVQPGDYWLCLPANVDSSRRTNLANDASPADFEDYTDVASHDLIDADANRTIELAGFTIRVNEKSALTVAGERPEQPDNQNSITIEHAKNGARIVMKADGSILIEGTKITLDAGSGDIELKAGKVDVSVTSEMNVH